jgi:hypothetical protein
MQQTSIKHLRLILFGVDSSLTDQIDQELHTRSIQLHLHQTSDHAELIRSLVDGLPHLVLFGTRLDAQQVEAASGFIQRTFPDLPVLMLASPETSKVNHPYPSVSAEPRHEVLNMIYAQVNRPTQETARSRKTRIMQQIDKSRQAIDQLEQQLGRGDLAIELLQSKRYLERLQAELRGDATCG